MALVLTRKVDQAICFEIGGELVTIYLGKVTMGSQDVSKYIRATVIIKAPRSVAVWRDELQPRESA